MIEHRHFFKKIKGASKETPLRSPMRAIHLRLADYQKAIRKGRKVQTYSGTINKGSRPGAESNKFCRVADKSAVALAKEEALGLWSIPLRESVRPNAKASGYEFLIFTAKKLLGFVDQMVDCLVIMPPAPLQGCVTREVFLCPALNAFVMTAPIRAKRNPGSYQPLLAEEEVPEVYIVNKALFRA